MTITNVDALLNALGNNSSILLIDKASIPNTAANQYHSLWRASGQPGVGAIPTTAAICDNSLAGRMIFPNQTSPLASYLSWASMLCLNAAVTIEIHDRLMHMGGLSGIVASPSAQTVNVDLHANLLTANLAERIGHVSYSDVSWWLEWYTDTGSGTPTVTVNVTYDDGTSGDLTVTAALGATRRASFMLPLNNLIPAIKVNNHIRDVNTLTLSATTGTAGNFGVTATRHRCSFPQLQANFAQSYDWAQLGFPEIFNDSCLMMIQYASTTSTGFVRGQAKISHG